MIFRLKQSIGPGRAGDAVDGRSPKLRAVGKAVFLSCFLASFSGCAIKRAGYDVPAVPLPAQYKNSSGEDAPSTTSVPVEATVKSAIPEPSLDVGMVEWWRSFGNAELAALIDRGIANNPDVRIATLKIAQVKARADQVRADQVPSIAANIGESIQAPGGQVGSVPVGETDRTTQKLYQASVRGNWRIDLWGEQSALAESAGLQVWQAAFERDNVQRSMVANLASAYVEYLSLNDRLRIAQEADAVLSGVLLTIEKRIEAGDATVIELDQQKATIFAVRATIPNLEQQREDAIASIAFLVGTVPGALSLSGDGLNALLLPNIVPALPSSLILRRPDVRMVEAKLLAADADVDVARARILPPLDLSAQMGYSSLAMSGLFQPLSLFWNAIANLTVSIFDSGKLSSQKDQARSVHEEMVENYARTIHQAVREVESALAAIRLTAKRFDAQQEATAAAQRAWDSSNEVYAVGGVDHLTLLDSGRTYLRYLDDYERIKMDRYRGYISLFQALGGGADFGQVIPGKGVRPTPVRGAFSAVATAPVAKKISSIEGVEWAAGQTIENGGAWQVERFWQVELPGLYHRGAIGPTWRDLRARYPKLMDGRIVRPRLSGRIEDSADSQVAWYRLFVAKFATPAAAETLCAALKASYQRCRVVSSVSDETVVAAIAAKPDDPPDFAESPKVVAAPPQLAIVSAVPPAKNAQRPYRPSLSDPPDFAESPKVVTAPSPLAKVSAMPPAKNVELPYRPSPSPMVDATREKLAYTLQLGAFSNLENAAISYEFWRFRELDVYVAEFKDAEGRNWYAVRSGIFSQRRDASLAAVSLRRKASASAVMLPTMVDAAGKPATIAVSDLTLPGAAPMSPVVPEPPEALEAPTSASGANESLPAVPLEDGKARFAYSVQLGAFSVLENAAVSFSFWQGKGYEVFISEIKDSTGRNWYAVRTGVYPRRDDAAASALFFGRGEDAPAVVVRTAVDQSGLPKTVDTSRLPPTVPATGRREPSAEPLAEAPRKNAQRINRTFMPSGSLKGKPAYTVQLGVFSSVENAAKALSGRQGRGYEAYVCEIEDAMKRVRYAVRTGAFPKRRDAAALQRLLTRREGVPAMVVPAILDRSGRLAVVDVADFNHSLGGGN